MNPRALLLVSLCINVALALAWTLNVRPGGLSDSAESPALSSSKSSTQVSSSGTSDAHSAVEPDSTAAKQDPSLKQDPALWRSLYSSDPHTMLARLRAAGVPDKYVRALISASVDELYAAKRKGLLSQELPPYWQVKGSSRLGGIDIDQLSKLSALRREQSDLVKTILGPSQSDSHDYAQLLRQRYGNLTSDKLESVVRVSQDYSEMQAQLTRQSSGTGFMLPEDREKLQTLRREQELDMKTIMSPSEFEEYQMRSSNTAMTLRRQLGFMEPSEAEYRTLFALQKSVDDQFPTNYSGYMDEAMMQQRSAAERKMMEQVKASLGDARFQDYERSKDTSFQIASRIVEAYNLPSANANAVYDLKKQVDSQMRSMRNQSGSERQLAMQSLNADVSAKLQQYLGDKGAAAYKQSNASFWLRNIERMTKSSPTTQGPGGP